MKEWIAEHWASGVTAVLIPLFGWVYKRDLKRIEKRQDEDTTRLNNHAERIRELEIDRVTRSDIDELRQSLTATMTNGLDRVEGSVRDLTRHLLNGAGR